MVAAVRLIRDVQGILKFMRLDEFMPQVFLARELFRLLPVVRGKTRRERRNRQGALAQRLVRHPGQVGRIRAAGKCHEHRAKFSQACG